MTVFEGLLVAHVIGDWLLQTEWQALNKARHWGALLAHVTVYHIIVLVVLLLVFDLNPALVVVVVAGLALFHALLDRRDFTNWYMRATRMVVHQDPPLWLRMAVDQSLHVVSLAAAALILTRISSF